MGVAVEFPATSFGYLSSLFFSAAAELRSVTGGKGECLTPSSLPFPSRRRQQAVIDDEPERQSPPANGDDSAADDEDHQSGATASLPFPAVDGSGQVAVDPLPLSGSGARRRHSPFRATSPFRQQLATEVSIPDSSIGPSSSSMQKMKATKTWPDKATMSPRR
nr:hypothetical protein Iba_chr12bCG3210 [Ipomoea batatas]